MLKRKKIGEALADVMMRNSWKITIARLILTFTLVGLYGLLVYQRVIQRPASTVIFHSTAVKNPIPMCSDTIIMERAVQMISQPSEPQIASLANDAAQKEETEEPNAWETCYQ